MGKLGKLRIENIDHRRSWAYICVVTCLIIYVGKLAYICRCLIPLKECPFYVGKESPRKNIIFSFRHLSKWGVRHVLLECLRHDTRQKLKCSCFFLAWIILMNHTRVGVMNEVIIIHFSERLAFEKIGRQRWDEEGFWIGKIPWWL